MSISIIGASSKQMRHMRDLQNNCHEESKEGLLQNQQCDIQIIVEGPKQTKPDLSIKSHHERVEREIKEKQAKVARLKGRYMRRLKVPLTDTTSFPYKAPAEGPWNSWSSWSTSHPITITCAVCAFMISIIGAIFILVVMLRKYVLDAMS